MSESEKESPKDLKFMIEILKEMGIVHYENRVTNLMLEFCYKYITEILEEAKLYSHHANKKVIDEADIKIAVENMLENSFTAPPPRDLLYKQAAEKNTIALPPIRLFAGIRIPPDRYCLTAPNYRLKSYRRMERTQSTPARVPTQQASSSGNNKYSVITRPQISTVTPVTPVLKTITRPAGTIQLVSGSNVSPVEVIPVETLNSLKRKREEQQ